MRYDVKNSLTFLYILQFGMEIVQQTTKCWGKRLKGYAKTLELKVNSYAIACVRQRPRDCRKEFQINLNWSQRTEHRDVRSWQKYLPPDTLQVRLRFQRGSSVIFCLQLCWKLSLNWSSGGRNYVFRNNRVELQLIAMRTFMRVNFHYFFYRFWVCLSKNPSFAVGDFIQINSY